MERIEHKIANVFHAQNAVADGLAAVMEDANISMPVGL
jgi:hypothetical protein